MKGIKKYLMLIVVTFFITQGFSYAQLRIPHENIPKNIHPEITNQIERLYSHDLIERTDAVIRLGEFGPRAAPAVQYLIGMLEDTSPLVLRTDPQIVLSTSASKQALLALEKIGPSAVGPLIATMKDKECIYAKKCSGSIGRDRRCKSS